MGFKDHSHPNHSMIQWGSVGGHLELILLKSPKDPFPPFPCWKGSVQADFGIPTGCAVEGLGLGLERIPEGQKPGKGQTPVAKLGTKSP